jgi:hypothetical protein
VNSAVAQDLNKDSITIKLKKCTRPNKTITILLENHTGKELLRTNPMGPLNIFKWNGKIWEQVEQLGYCSCGMLPCPPPPELLPFNVNEVLSFDWDQKKSKCLNMQEGTKEYSWAGKGKYKVVFEFKKEQYGDAFQVEKTFTIR